MKKDFHDKNWWWMLDKDVVQSEQYLQQRSNISKGKPRQAFFGLKASQSMTIESVMDELRIQCFIAERSGSVFDICSAVAWWDLFHQNLLCETVVDRTLWENFVKQWLPDDWELWHICACRVREGQAVH